MHNALSAFLVISEKGWMQSSRDDLNGQYNNTRTSNNPFSFRENIYLVATQSISCHNTQKLRKSTVIMPCVQAIMKYATGLFAAVSII